MAKVTLGELGLGADDLAAIGKLSESGMTPDQIADNIKEANGFVNTDNPNIKLSYGKTTKALTKAFDVATHTIAVKIGGIHDVAIDGTMKVIIKEGGTNLTRELLISGHWDGYSATKQWIAGGVKENTAQSTPLECKFAKDATSIYVILGAIEARGTLKVAISDVMTNFIDANPMTMEIVSLANLTGLTTDLTRSDILVGLTASASEINVSVMMVGNVKNYGAIPDYTGTPLYDGLDGTRITATDNTEAFRLALETNKALGRDTIFVPNGHYGFKTGNILLDSFKSISIVGESRDGTILDYIKEDNSNSAYVEIAKANSIFRFRNGESVEIKNITIKGTTKYGTVDDSISPYSVYYGAVWGVIIQMVVNINIDNVYVNRFNYRGMSFSVFSECNVENSIAEYNVGSGFWADNGTTFKVSKSKLMLSGIKGFYSTGYGVAASNKITNFIVDDVYAGKNYRKGIDAHGAINMQVTNSILEDNIMSQIANINVGTVGDIDCYIENNRFYRGRDVSSRTWIDEAHQALIDNGLTITVGAVIDISMPVGVVSDGIIYASNNKILSQYSGLGSDEGSIVTQDILVKIISSNCDIIMKNNDFLLAENNFKENGDIYTHFLFQFSGKNIEFTGNKLEDIQTLKYVNTATSLEAYGALFYFSLRDNTSKLKIKKNDFDLTDGYIQGETSGGAIRPKTLLSTYELIFEENNIKYKEEMYPLPSRLNTSYFFAKTTVKELDYSSNRYTIGDTSVNIPKRLNKSVVIDSISTGKSYVAGATVFEIYMDRVYACGLKISFGNVADDLILYIPDVARNVMQVSNNSLLELASYEDVVIDGIKMQKIAVKAKAIISSTIAYGKVEANISAPSLGVYKIVLL